jgi:hypothetical protein
MGGRDNRRVRLDEKDFITLIKGGEVEQDGVKIILADIGYDRMMSIIRMAWLEHIEKDY